MAEPADPVLVRTRLGLHAVAEHVVSAALYSATGHLGLRVTPGGFGTPWFDPADRPGSPWRRVRVQDLDLVVEEADGPDDAPSVGEFEPIEAATVARGQIVSVGQAASLAGITPGVPDLYPSATALEPARPLALQPAAVERVAAFFATVDAALVELATRLELDDRAGAAEAVEPAQLWPEHFDLGRPLSEVNYGGSPGDDAHPEPYLYVGPWTPPTPDGGYWNEPFGASRIAPADLRVDEAAAFFDEGRRRHQERPELT